MCIYLVKIDLNLIQSYRSVSLSIILYVWWGSSYRIMFQRRWYKSLIKDLDTSKKILEIKIHRNMMYRKSRLFSKSMLKICLKFLTWVIQRLWVLYWWITLISFNHLPNTNRDDNYISTVPHTDVVGCLLYDMVCTTPNIA